ncbi:MAG: hypothetical protein ABJN65_18105 [Parasphingorhabdus sp.]
MDKDNELQKLFKTLNDVLDKLDRMDMPLAAIKLVEAIHILEQEKKSLNDSSS